MPELVLPLDLPNCSIILYFYEGDEVQAIPSRFSYYCSHSGTAWQVLPDGSIHPPSRSRIVKIQLNGFPVLPGAVVRFAGFQLATTNHFPPGAPHWTPADDLPPGVTLSTPDGYPPANPHQETLGPLTLDLSQADSRLFYRLAVKVGDHGGLVWDDPKIYDDGSM